MTRIAQLVAISMLLPACLEQSFRPATDSVDPDSSDDPAVAQPYDGPVGRVALSLCTDVDDGRSLGGVLVRIAHDYGVIAGRTDEQGRVELDDVPVGTWVIEAVRGGAWFAYEVRVLADETSIIETTDCHSIADLRVLAHTSGTLFEVDLQTGDTLPMGSFKLEGAVRSGITDIAVEADSGQAYAVTNDGDLYALDAATGALEFACDVPSGSNAVAWSGDGRLVLGASDELWTVDPYSCDRQRMLTLTGQYSDGDIAPAGVGQVYWAVSGGAVLKVDLATGAFDQAYAHDQAIYGLSWVDGELLGFSPQGTVWRLDSEAGRETAKVQTAQSWWGAAAGPVAQ